MAIVGTQQSPIDLGSATPGHRDHEAARRVGSVFATPIVAPAASMAMCEHHARDLQAINRRYVLLGG